jgi:biotin synthase-related radical SAM superfamily protein
MAVEWEELIDVIRKADFEAVRKDGEETVWEETEYVVMKVMQIIKKRKKHT